MTGSSAQNLSVNFAAVRGDVSELSEAEGTHKPRAKAKRPPPFSMRLTSDESVKLDAVRGDMPLGAYIKQQALGETGKPRRRRRQTVADTTSLAKVLALLGKSRLPQTMRQIAKAANLGTLPVQPETETDIRQACYDIAVMRFLLMKALGKFAEPPP
ncbi:MAG: hypothetical protein AAGF33_11995 [Pseudomonadota bacterium]